MGYPLARRLRGPQVSAHARESAMSCKSAFLAAACLALTSLWLVPTARAGDTAWGAIAIDVTQKTSEPSYGVGGGATEAEASENATGFCQKTGSKAGCKIVVTYQQCGAFASNGHDAGWAKAPSKKEAEAAAVKACGQSDCAVAASDCN